MALASALVVKHIRLLQDIVLVERATYVLYACEVIADKARAKCTGCAGAMRAVAASRLRSKGCGLAVPTPTHPPAATFLSVQ